MAQNKTEKATPKKQREARKKGSVAFSTDACAAAGVGVGLMLIGRYVVSGFAGWKRLLEALWRPENFGASEWVQTLNFGIKTSAVVMLPVFGAGLLVGFLQVGPLFRTIKPDPTHINPAQGFKNLFNRKKIVELIKTTLKFCLTLGILIKVVWDRLLPVWVASEASIENLLSCFGQLTGQVFKYTVVLVIVYGAFDFFLQKHRWLKDLKMSRQEVLEEYKTTEGDPQMKGLRRQCYQEILQAGLADRVSRSRVVVVNPTRYAVAVEYEDQWQGAPRITAKGYMGSAARLRAIAAKHNVPVLRHPPLARKLFELGIDQEIPEDLFQAVAELLVFIIRLTPEDRKRYR